MHKYYLLLIFYFSLFSICSAYDYSCNLEIVKCPRCNELRNMKCEGGKHIERERYECNHCDSFGHIICANCNDRRGYYVRYCLSNNSSGSQNCKDCYSTDHLGYENIKIHYNKCRSNKEYTCPDYADNTKITIIQKCNNSRKLNVINLTKWDDSDAASVILIAIALCGNGSLYDMGAERILD